MFPDLGLIAIVPILIFGFVIFMFVVVFGTIIFVFVKNVQKARALGHDPLTMETELAARAIDSSLLAPTQTIESRLRELDDLHLRKVITEAEYTKARAEAISAG
jgi:hypothetical protein